MYVRYLVYGALCVLPDIRTFDSLERYWLIIFLLLMFTLPRWYVVICLLCIPTVRASIMFMCSVPLILLGGRYKIMRATSRAILTNCFNLKFNMEALPIRPTIFICNYPSNIIEYLLPSVISENTCIMISNGNITGKLTHAFGVDNVLLIERGGNFEITQEQVRNKLQSGFNVFVYIERNFVKRKHKYELSPIRSGIFKIANNIGATITPIVIDHIDHKFGAIDNHDFTIHVDSTRLVTDVDREMSTVTKMYKRKLRQLSMK